jgi:60S ribosome subunit biogenesis protein NIP7
VCADDADPSCRVPWPASRITEDTPQYCGVVVLNMADVPLGFGTTAKSTAEVRKMEPQGVVAFHQADVGEYLRDEETLC